MFAIAGFIAGMVQVARNEPTRDRLIIVPPLRGFTPILLLTLTMGSIYLTMPLVH